MLDSKAFEKAMKNSEFVLFKIAEAKAGDNIIVIGDSASYQNDLLFCHCAKNHGINAMRIDLDIYGGEEDTITFP